MSDTIREQIISAIIDKLAIVRKKYGYQTDCGKNVFRIRRAIPDDLDALIVFPKAETSIRDYDADKITMPIHIEGFKNFGENNASEIGEEILGDMIEAIAGRRWILDYTSGGTFQPRPGATIEGASSGATGYVESVSVSSGAWADGDASGTITIRRKSGTFESENLDIGDESNVATTDGSITYQTAEESTTDSLAEDIQYLLGGTDENPEEGQVIVGVLAIFNITYSIVAGDPFSQP